MKTVARHARGATSKHEHRRDEADAGDLVHDRCNDRRLLVRNVAGVTTVPVTVHSVERTPALGTPEVLAASKALTAGTTSIVVVLVIIVGLGRHVIRVGCLVGLVDFVGIHRQ